MKITINKVNVGLRIKNIRYSFGDTLEKFGTRINADKSNILRWERGLTLPNKKRLLEIANLGNITVNELLYGSIDEFLNNNLEQLKMSKIDSPHYINLNIKEIVKKYLLDKEKNINDISEIVNILEKNFDEIINYSINEYIIENINMLDEYRQLTLEILIEEPALRYAIYDIHKDNTENLDIYLTLLLTNDISYNYKDIPSDFNSYNVLKEILNGNNEKQKYIIYPFFSMLIDFIKYKLQLVYSNDIMREQIRSTIENELEKNGVYNIPYQEVIVNNLTNAIIDKMIEMINK